MQLSKIQWIIEILEAAREVKMMYIQPVTVDSAINFLNGFRLGMFCLDEKIPGGVRDQAHKDRGYNYTAMGTERQMRARQMSDEEIMDELFALEIEAWKLMIDNSE